MYLERDVVPAVDRLARFAARFESRSIRWTEPAGMRTTHVLGAQGTVHDETIDVLHAQLPETGGDALIHLILHARLRIIRNGL